MSEEINSIEVLNQVCVICQEQDNRPIAKLGGKGCQGLSSAAKTYKGQDLVFVPGQIVHIDCRKRFCHPNQLHTEKSTPNSLSSPKTRQSSSSNKFDFETKCLFCGFDAKYKDGKRGNDIHPVTTLEFEFSIREACKSRGDEGGDSVFGRLESVHDLPAVEARYHQACSTNFRSGYNVPKLYVYDSVKPKKGRPSKQSTDVAFSQLMKYFEDHESEQMTVNDLVDRMNELCGELSYSTVYMKKKILEHFGDSVVITELNGKHNAVTFKSTAHSILHSFYKRSNTNDSDCEKKAIVKTASKLILNEIKNMSDISKEEYPSSADIMSTESNYNFLPEGLQCFLKQLIDSSNCDRKIASIGQAIVQAAAPRRAISPLQIGLGVQMHHHFGSKFLIETLNSLGFCSSYHDVQRFEQSAAVSQGIEIEKSNEQFVQFIGDNVDHNID